MTFAKRITAMILCVLMIASAVSFGSFANEQTEAAGWSFLGAKFSATTFNPLPLVGTSDPKMEGFTFDVNSNGGIDVHLPETNDETSKGVYPVGVITNSNATALDNLSVVIQPGENVTAKQDRYGYAQRISVMFSTSPVTHLVQFDDKGKPVSGSGMENAEGVYTNGLRYIMPAEGDTVLVSTANSYDKYAGKIMSDVVVITYDGVFSDSDDGRPGYRWVFSGNESKDYLRLDISKGLVFEFVPDTTLGYKITVNGNEYYKGKDVAYFPHDPAMAIEKAKADISLAQFVGKDGYLTVGANSNETNALDYTVEKINGYPAATWAGEAPAAHTHSFEKTVTEPTCSHNGITECTCSCGQHFIQTNIKAAGHSWATNYKPHHDMDNTIPMYTASEEFLAKYPAPTCTTDGIEHKICTVCGESEDVVLPKLNHQYKYGRPEDYQEAELLREYYATRWGDWEITTPATATTAGVKTRHCILCGAEESMSYTKYDDSEDILDNWYVSGETKTSRSNGNVKGTITPIAVNLDGKRTYTTVNDDGSITVKDEPAQTGKIDNVNAFDNSTKIMSKHQSHLNGFSAKVQMIPSTDAAGRTMYADTINFCWSNKYENFCYAGQIGGGSMCRLINTVLEDNRIGFLWDNYVTDEFTFTVTLMDGVVVWNTYQYGTLEDGYYDVAFYASVGYGNLWNIQYALTGYDLNNDYNSTNIRFDPAEPIEVQTFYGYDEDEGTPDMLSFCVNGFLIYCTGLSRSQSYDPFYYFGVAAFGADRGQRPAAFTLLDVCGEKPTEFDGYTDPNACDHDWSEYVYQTKVVKRNGKNVKVDRVETCYDKGAMISTCANCEGTRTKYISETPHKWSRDKIIREETCSSDGFGYRHCGKFFLTDADEDAFCDGMEYYVIPATGHDFGEWTVTKEATENEKGLKERTCKNCGVKETEDIPALEPVKPDNPFEDIPETSWYTDACLWCNSKTYMTGLTKTTFGPNEKLTRAQFVQILAKVEGVDLSKITYRAAFKDVPAGKWYTNAIIWAVDFGVTGGIGGGNFGPNDQVTRAQLASFLRTYAEKKGKDVSGRTDITGYDDYADVAGWAKDPMSWAVNAGLISSTSKTAKLLAPKTVATRAQVALIIKNLCENILK